MSLILDAINKSEQQRPQVETVPGVGTMHDADAAEQPSPWRRLLWPVLTVVLASLAIVLWLDSKTPAPAEEVAPPVQAASPALPEPVRLPSQPAPVRLPSQQAPVRLPSQPAPDLIAYKVASAPAPSAAEPPPIVGGTDVAALYTSAASVDDNVPVPVDPGIADAAAVEAAPGETTDPVPQPAPLDIEAIARVAQKALDEQVAEPVEVVHAVPLISELKQRTKDDIPSLFYSSHHWSTVAAERVVTLNGQARREGDLVKPGLRLLEILEDSIVLDYRGTEFRLRSLNSWVNL
jgi:general secretion pathway protein B